MTLGLFVLCAAAAALLAFSTSAVIGLSLASLRARLERLAAAGRARLLFGVTLLPLLVCVAGMTAALAPSFGWVADHCSFTIHTHAHPHICSDHHVAGIPATTLVALGGVLVARVVLAIGRAAWGTLGVLRVERALRRISRPASGAGGDVRVLPLSEPQAFVLGALRPTLFVTSGLLAPPHREHLAPVLRHERAHLERRDPLRRLVSSIALGFHLPGVAEWLARRLACAQEMAADADAARDLGSPERVARALVGLVRAQRASPRLALGFGASDVEARVAELLDRRARRDQPRWAVLIALAALALAVIAGSAGAVHHGVEIALGLLGG